MQQKHFLLYGHGGSYNHGGEAITRCTIDLLRKQVPDCFITLSTHFPEQDREFGLIPDEIITRNCSTRDNALMYRDTLERITSDTTVIQVGGDNYCYTNWQRYAQIHQKAKECGGKSILWGCSIDANAIDDEMLGILQAHDLVLARECLTYRTLVKAGLTNVIKVSDIAFGLEPQKVEFPFNHYIVLNLSPLVCRKNAEVLDAYRNLITLIMDQTDYSVVLLPHVVMPVDNDKDVLDELGFHDNTRVVRVSDKLSAGQYKYIISRADLCVAARTHVTIAAYSSCVPTLAIGYSTKASGIAMDLGFLEYVIPIENENLTEKICESFKKLQREQQVLRNRLNTEMQQYKEQAVPDSVIAFLRGEQE